MSVRLWAPPHTRLTQRYETHMIQCLRCVDEEGGEGLEEEGRERGKIGSVLTLFLPSLPIPPPVTCPDPTQDGKVSSYHRRRLSKSTKRSDGSEVEKMQRRRQRRQSWRLFIPLTENTKLMVKRPGPKKLALRHPTGKGTVPR